MQSTDLKSLILKAWRGAWGIAALLLLALLAVPAHAQYGASLQGTVADPTGALIPGTTLTLTDTETGRTLTTQSNSTGTFVFSALAPSLYRLEASRDGFKKRVIDNFKIFADQANALNVVLEVGTTAESVTVNAATQPLLDTATGAVGATIDQNEIDKLPSFGRDVFQLVQLAPGMFGDGSRSGGGDTNSLPG
ncbi:MAG: carboxypeptidase-like regulatory domain-containing protein, partial [Terracidiphilus sp.]